MARGLGDLKKTLDRLARVPAQTAGPAAERIATLIDHEFDAGADPYGRPWAPLAASTLARGRTPPPLTDTHDMRDSARVLPMPGAGISITIDDPAIHHTYGAPKSKLPQRQILPHDGMPRSWAAAISSATAAEFRRAVSG